MTQWRGNVTVGVDAWLGGDARLDQEEPASAPPAPEDAVALGPDADPEKVARTILLDQLTGRARTRHELADKLRSKGVPDEVATRLLDRFTEVGLINDAAFARQWVETRQASRGLAKRALADELRRKGIDGEVAKEALEELDPADEEATARALVRKKLPSLRRFDNATVTRRLAGLLARKGYPAGLAFAVVRDELKAEDAGEDTFEDVEDGSGRSAATPGRGAGP